MKLKLTHSQFFVIYDLLGSMVMNGKPSGIEMKLFHSVLISVYKKFFNKAWDRNRRRYTVSLNDEQACAWWLFFSKIELPAAMTFERITLLQINNSIHQKFAV